MLDFRTFLFTYAQFWVCVGSPLLCSNIKSEPEAKAVEKQWSRQQLLLWWMLIQSFLLSAPSCSCLGVSLSLSLSLLPFILSDMQSFVVVFSSPSSRHPVERVMKENTGEYRRGRKWRGGRGKKREWWRKTSVERLSLCSTFMLSRNEKCCGAVRELPDLSLICAFKCVL